MDFEKRIITDGETVIDKELLEYMEDGIVEAINIADNKADKSEINKCSAYGTCNTEAATSEKVVVIDDPNWKLEVGSLIMVRFSVTNTASNVTLNVNNTGAYGIRSTGESAYTGSSSTYCGNGNRSLTYIFDGSYWQWISAGGYPSSATNVSLGQGYTTCSTAASTKAKTASLSSYVLSTGGIVVVKFTNDVPASATLNINSKGAKAIYYKGVAITDGIIKAGDTATFIYSTRYHLISIDRDETFSGDYNDLTNKPAIPTKTSELTNDSGFLNAIPSEYITDSELNSKGYATQTFVQNEIAKIGTTVSTLPVYWKNRLDEISPKIEEIQMQNGMDTLQFLWCSDIHGMPGTSPSNTTYIGDIGRYLMDKHNIPFFVVSGDIMSQASHANIKNIWDEYDKLTSMLSPISNEEFLAIRGNHDGVWGSPMEYNGQANQYYHSYIGDKALFNAFMRRQTLDRYKRVFGKDGMYFYVDYHNYRIYLLNGHTFGDNSVNEQGQAIYNGFKHAILGSEQIQWVADTLNTVAKNQQVLFICHAQLNQQLDFEVFNTMINHYIARTSGNASKTINQTYWGTNSEYANIQVNFDFTNAKGSILGWFNGHIHSDSIKTDLFNNLPIFTITTAGGDIRDTYYTDGTLTRTKGTATETAMDLVTVTSDYIYFTRIGSGYDRKYNRLTKEVTIDYDSTFVPGVDEEESIVYPTGSEVYLNKRYSSSGGGLLGINGMFAIIIPIDADGTKEYTLKFENLPKSITSTTNNTFYVLDSAKAVIGYANEAASFTAMGSELTLNNDGTTAEVTFTPSALAAYVVASICVDDLVIADFDLNGIVITLEAQGTELTQGEITNEVTWNKDKRLSSSSGNYSELTGSYASSDISCKNGDIIRLYNVSKGTNHNYVAAYGSSYLGFVEIAYDDQVSSNSYITAIRSNGVTTITVLHDSVVYLRVCSNGGIDPSTVRITKNMEI